MDKEEILHIIKQGENETIEFKTSFGKEVIESIVAFSNTKGGKIIVGVNDNKNIAGISVADESIQNWLNQIKQNTDPQVIPDVQIFEFNNRNIVVFDVMEYPIKPVSCRNKYFKRIANSNHLMRLDEITNEHLKTINTSWDFYPDPIHGIEHISEEKIKHFISKIEKRTQSKIELTPFDFLTRLEIIRNNQHIPNALIILPMPYAKLSSI
jgi:ATP-dependent DNA helicase RecG